jgi:hypothetical protein
MLKSGTELLAADPRNQAIPIDDLHSMVRGITLDDAVPTGIRDQFDTARNVFAYSWFVYEFTMLAEQQCYFALEMALRQRLNPEAKPNTTKSPGLSNLLKAATERGYLQRKEFDMPSMSEAGGTFCQLDFIPFARNHLAHGNINLLPQYALMQIELTAKILNQLLWRRALNCEPVSADQILLSLQSRVARPTSRRS